VLRPHIVGTNSTPNRKIATLTISQGEAHAINLEHWGMLPPPTDEGADEQC
jgi:hypothetical protein